ncbi:MAG: penicillin acylase family protein [Candidatus Marinimicrobia bacterium]|nr:penicillin acylase family protein [Candidatus Neomarinimicrobiota bacterium]MDP6836015.1 penicillin acylase family protein [Candidatus Neomarinimicrobiota bacterium]
MNRLITVVVLTAALITASLAADRTLTAPDGSTVSILRDEYGVPHIIGENEVGVFFGQGFAVAEDRLNQMEFHRRAAEGRMAEVLGGDLLGWDKLARTVGYTEEERRQQYDDLPLQIQSFVSAYAMGVNTFLDTMALNPNKYKPQEIVLLNIKMEPWTTSNSLAVSQYLGRNFGQFGGSELSRLVELQNQGQDWFDDNRPINDPEAPTTIQDGGAAAQREWHYSGMTVRPEVVDKLERRQTGIKVIADQYNLPTKFGSFAVLVTPERSSSGNVILLGCPQMGEPRYNEVQIANEVELDCPQFHVGGMSVAGIPGVIIGHTEHHAWSMTSGVSDNTDIYIDSTKDASFSQYYYNGEWHDFEVITDTIHVRLGASEIFTHYRTVHGPIIAEDLEKQQVFAEKMAFWKEEVTMMKFFYNSYKATTLEQFENLVRDHFVMNFNLHYADQDQNVKYWHAGKFQDRSDGVDPRLPHKGDGSEEWGGFIPFEDLPQADGTDQEYFVNWNNKPVSWWDNGDNVPWVGDHRVRLMYEYVDPISSIAYDDVKAVPQNLNSHGSYQQVFELTGDGWIDENIVPPGQSGFISWMGVRSPHFDDQWQLHRDWEFKDMLFGELTVSVDTEPTLPQYYSLYQNYPNPFNATTAIGFDVPEASELRIAIYDLSGREVAVLVSGGVITGRHEVAWDASGFPSGLYFAQLIAGNLHQTMKLILLK